MKKIIKNFCLGSFVFILGACGKTVTVETCPVGSALGNESWGMINDFGGYQGIESYHMTMYGLIGAPPILGSEPQKCGSLNFIGNELLATNDARIENDVSDCNSHKSNVNFQVKIFANNQGCYVKQVFPINKAPVDSSSFWKKTTIDEGGMDSCKITVSVDKEGKAINVSVTAPWPVNMLSKELQSKMCVEDGIVVPDSIPLQ